MSTVLLAEKFLISILLVPLTGNETLVKKNDNLLLCFVLFQYEELSTISGMPTAPSLTIEEYETIVENCQLGDAEPQKFVVKNPCVLNKLKSFHCIGRAGHLMRFLTWSKNRRR